MARRRAGSGDGMQRKRSQLPRLWQLWRSTAPWKLLRSWCWSLAARLRRILQAISEPGFHKSSTNARCRCNPDLRQAVLCHTYPSVSAVLLVCTPGSLGVSACAME